VTCKFKINQKKKKKKKKKKKSVNSTAAAFIGEFVDCPRWAHLDIAGPAAEEDGKTGATGASVDLLVNFVARSA
jgi:leucyl aminopeptidase